MTSECVKDPYYSTPQRVLYERDYRDICRQWNAAILPFDRTHLDEEDDGSATEIVSALSATSLAAAAADGRDRMHAMMMMMMLSCICESSILSLITASVTSFRSVKIVKTS